MRQLEKNPYISKEDIRRMTMPPSATPLHSACSTGQLKAVLLLLNYGADVLAGDHREKTALDIAKSKGFSSIVAKLEEEVAAKKITGGSVCNTVDESASTTSLE